MMYAPTYLSLLVSSLGNVNFLMFLEKCLVWPNNNNNKNINKNVKVYFVLLVQSLV